MNKEEVLKLVDEIMHCYASNYRDEAKQMVENKFKNNYNQCINPHEFVYRGCELCEYKSKCNNIK